VFDAGAVADLIRDTPRILNGGPSNPVREADLLSPTRDAEYLIARNGDRIEVSIDAGVLRDGQDRVAGIVLSFRDINSEQGI
jgi:hypothetical protein